MADICFKFWTKTGHFAFLSPLWGFTYAVHLRLIGKLVVDFLFVLIELFRYLLRLRRYERLSIGNRRF